jgi:hypothetical protein
MSTTDSKAYSGVRLTRVLKLIRPVKFVKLVRLAHAFQISRSNCLHPTSECLCTHTTCL